MRGASGWGAVHREVQALGCETHAYAVRHTYEGHTGGLVSATDSWQGEPYRPRSLPGLCSRGRAFLIMGNMRLIGIEPRAADATRALNRLRWEIDYAIEQETLGGADLFRVAEAVGIMTNLLQALGANVEGEPRDEVAALFGSQREKFIAHVGYFTEYHKVGR